MTKRRFRAAYILWLLFAGFVFATVVTRAAVTNITDDEAYTYLNYVRHIDVFRWDTVRWMFRESLANNHLLNTYLINLCERLFKTPYSEFVIRMPSLLSFVLYLSVISHALRKQTISFACAMLLAGNYYLNEFYGLARGYGMANTFVFLASLSYLAWQDSGYGKQKHLTNCALFLLLGMLANTIVLMLVPAFGILWLVRLQTHGELVSYLRRRWYVVCGYLAGSLLCVRYHLNVSTSDKPLYTGQGSFLRMTVVSYFEMFGENKKGVILLGGAALLCFLFCAVRLKKKLLREDLFLVLVLFLATCVLTEAVFHKGYITGRVILPFYALTVLAGERLVKDALAADPPLPQKMLARLRVWGSVAVFAACVLLFAHRFNMRATKDWAFDYGRRELMLGHFFELQGEMPPVEVLYDYCDVFYCEKFSGKKWEP